MRRGDCHRIPLNATDEELWTRTSRAFRKGVNKALRSGLRVEEATSVDALQPFYRMLTDLRRQKFGILPQPVGYYEQLHSRFMNEGHGAVWLALLGDRPVAAACILEHGNSLYDKMGVSDTEYLDMRPNNLLLWEVMRRGRERGLEYLDMGLSPESNPGLIRFKEGLGGNATPVRYYRWLPQNHDSAQEAVLRETLSGLTAILTRPDVPESAVFAASNLLYRNFG
nr:GNAT family N-acetyltransferase [Fundidesulfovibrio terrae]